eukprot:TRINITY_DN12244_c0_g1_i2.p1 TRINITY_DN12244_c0_g1~~TRINITY_DN12244_c0_g1_i2.p1  ORF type:complete len:107 (-),score=18.01 TRINITY_DN12244_c0_g1_i2:417-737(-)
MVCAWTQLTQHNIISKAEPTTKKDKGDHILSKMEDLSRAEVTATWTYFPLMDIAPDSKKKIHTSFYLNKRRSRLANGYRSNLARLNITPIMLTIAETWSGASCTRY